MTIMIYQTLEPSQVPIDTILTEDLRKSPEN